MELADKELLHLYSHDEGDDIFTCCGYKVIDDNDITDQLCDTTCLKCAKHFVEGLKDDRGRL